MMAGTAKGWVSKTGRINRPEAGGRKYGSVKKRWIANSLTPVALVVLFAVFLVCFGSSQYYYASLRTSLINRATSTSQFMNLFLSRGYEEFYNSSAKVVSDFVDRDKLELQVVDSMGRVMFSSSGVTAGFIPTTGDVSQSLSGVFPAVWSGVDRSTGERVMSVSAPLYYLNGQVIGAVRYTTSLVRVDRHVSFIVMAAGITGFAIFVLIFVSNYYFIRSIVNPVLRLNTLARSIAAGNYGIQIENTLDDEIGELSDSVNYMSEEISRAEKMKNDIISSVSHELRTPLTAIGGWSETLLDGGAADRDTLEKGLSIIHKESHRLSRMVEELLDFARLEDGRMTLQTELFDLRGEFADAAFVYNDMLKKDEILVRYDESEDPVMVMGDRNRLKQVFLNLLDNAAKYGGSGGAIELSIGVEDGQAMACVRDFGPGIPAEDLPFIKEKFYRGSAQTQRGAGIGLSVSDEIVRLHGGTLDIESRPGEGVKAVIRLPLAEEGQTAAG